MDTLRSEAVVGHSEPDTPTTQHTTLVQFRQGLATMSYGQQLQAIQPPMPVQFNRAGGQPAVHQTAAEGVSGGGSELPHLSSVQQSFGRHDIAGVKAHVGSAATAANEKLHSKAYATGNDIAFKSAPSQHLVAHEAAHVVQQRAGISLPGGVGSRGDAYERNADAVADAVSRGTNAEPLLDQIAAGPTSKGTPSVQHQVQKWDDFIEAFKAKRKAVTKLVDPEWITDAAWSAAVYPLSPNPRHNVAFWKDMFDIVNAVKDEVGGYASRIVHNAENQDEIDAIVKEFEAWKPTRAIRVQQEVKVKYDEYVEIEKKWLQHYLTHDLSQDGVHLNKNSSRSQKLSLVSGKKSVLTVETRCAFVFDLSAAATTAGMPAWTAAEQAAYITAFQTQLDQVWGPQAGQPAPFVVKEPTDHLLENESDKWSTMTGEMKGKVTKTAAANAHFAVRITRLAAGENKRAAVSSGSAHFYERDAAAGMAAGSVDQKTLAHEWLHMIGNPDEYAEVDQKLAEFYLTAFDWFKSIRELLKDHADLDKLKRQYATDPATGEDNIFGYSKSKRPDIPDWLFKERGSGSNKVTLRPGARSQRGGLWISRTTADEARLSDEGNQVDPYMREGVVEGLNSMLDGQFNPEVRFEHNFAAMSVQDFQNALTVRMQNLYRDHIKSILGR